MTQRDLKRCLFPIGDYEKPKVRAIAKKAGLPTAEKKDSQGVCFLGDISMEDFLRARIPAKKGALVMTSGERIGTHHGAAFYTVGQRHINAEFVFPKTGGKQDRKPFYVVGKDIKKNLVIVAEGSEHPSLYQKEIMLANVNFLKRKTAGEVFARVRYRQPLTKATLKKADGSYRLLFDKPQKFVAEGQSAVFYSKAGEMLGGGVIIRKSGSKRSR